MNHEKLIQNDRSCPNAWCKGTLTVKNPKHPKANIRCDTCNWTMYLSNYERLNQKALDAKRTRERMVEALTIGNHIK